MIKNIGESKMEVWIIMLKDEDGTWMTRAYSKKEEAVAEMKRLYDQHIEHEPNAVIDLKESDEKMVITLCGDDFIVSDAVVMLELEVDGFKKVESKIGRQCIPFQENHPDQECEDFF